MAEHRNIHLRCNICGTRLEPSQRDEHRQSHNLTWKDIAENGIFAYSLAELNIPWTEDGSCPICNGPPDDNYYYKIDNDGYFEELLRCDDCGQLYYSWLSRGCLGLASLFKVNTDNKEEDKKDNTGYYGEKCINCDFAEFRYGDFICTNTKYPDTEIVITSESKACREFVKQTTEHLMEITQDINNFFIPQRQVVEKLPIP